MSYPNNFNTDAFDRAWGHDAEPDHKQAIMEGIKQLINSYVAKHDIDISDKAINYALECMDDCVSDMLSNYKGSIAKSVDRLGLHLEYHKFISNKYNPPLSFETWKRESEGK